LLQRTGTPVFTAVITASGFGLIGAGAATINGLGPAGSAALTAGVGLVVSPFAPLLSFRISRLTLPPIVTNAQELRADVDTVDGRTVLGQAALADHVLTGLAVGIAAAVGFGGIRLAATTDNTAARILAAVLAVVCLLRARVFGGVWQRIGFLSAAAAVGAALLWEIGATTSDLTRILALIAPATVAGLVLFGLAALVPGRPIAPTWGRAADILESLLVLSVIPLTLGVIGVYGAIRGLSNQ
jgi:type VII secretion integral membrane protein EccD